MNVNASTKKVLVVDDDEMLCKMFALVIGDEGYQVETAFNGLEAWAKVQGNGYDMLVSDMFMPEMNGFELISKCQEADAIGKIILISGGGAELDGEDGATSVSYTGQTLQVDLFLKKPCDLIKMIESVNQLF